MNPDMSAYLGVFLDEAQEQLVLLETHCINLERSTEPDEELQVLFRAAHTLKGSSRAMGFLAIGDLTHEMENVLDDLRNHILTLTPTVVDSILGCLDALRSMIDGVAANGSEPDGAQFGIPTLITTLATVRSGGLIAANSPVESGDVALEAEIDGTTIEVCLSDGCLMKGIRAVIVVNAIKELADIRHTKPSEHDLEEENFESTFLVGIEPHEDTESLLARVRSLPEVVRAELHLVETTEAAPEGSEAADSSSSAPVQAEVKAAVEARSEVQTQGRAPSSQTVRVDVNRLDILLNLVGELVTERNQVSTLVTLLEKTYKDDQNISALQETLGRVGRITTELQEEVMKTRMLPIDGVFQRMPRMVRDVAQKLGKEVDFVMGGGETELDRSVLDVLGDPLIHLLRNAVDHGVEMPDERVASGKDPRGTVHLSARHERGMIIVEITDDGKGIEPQWIRRAAVNKGVISEAGAETLSDREALNLIFAPGFSTASEISDISGRGVGMDIVRSNIEKIGGRVFVESTPGTGSSFVIQLPLTLAIVRAVLVTSEGFTYALPVNQVTELIDLDDSNTDITHCSMGGQAAIMLRGQTMPAVNLAGVLQGERASADPERTTRRSCHAVIVRNGDVQTALCVDELKGEQEIVIKPLGTFLGDIPGIAGASILGDGQVALIVDPSRAVQTIFSANAA